MLGQPLSAGLRGSVLTEGGFSSSQLPLIACGDGLISSLLQLLPFSIGVILIGPFPGTDMEEKALGSTGFWLWDRAHG